MCFSSALQPETSICMERLWLAAPDQKRAERNRTGERAERDSRDYEKSGPEKGRSDRTGRKKR